MGLIILYLVNWWEKLNGGEDLCPQLSGCLILIPILSQTGPMCAIHQRPKLLHEQVENKYSDIK